MLGVSYANIPPENQLNVAALLKDQNCIQINFKPSHHFEKL